MQSRFRNLLRGPGQLASALLTILIPLIVIATYHPLGIYYSNQHLYYLRGLYQAGVNFLQNDPEAMMRPTHIAFAWLVYLLQRINWLAGGSQFLATILLILFGLSMISISIGIVRGWKSQAKQKLLRHEYKISLVIAALFVIFLQTSIPARLNYMAGMSLFSQFLQASGFGVFILSGIGFLTLRRWRLSCLSLIVASVFHANYFVLCIPLMFIMVYEMYRCGNLREGIILLGLFTIVNLPFFILGPFQWKLLNSAEAIHTLNFVRSPHHYDVKVWWNETELIKLVVIILASVLAIWKHAPVLRNIMLIFFAYITSGIVIVAVTGNDTVASLLPWRASAFLLPLSQLIIIGTVVIILFDIISERKYTAIVVLVCVLTSIYYSSLSPWEWADPYRRYTTPEIEMVQQYTQETDLILIPPRMDENFRLYAQRPTFVTWKATGYYVDDWFNRVQVAETMMDADIDTQEALCIEYGFDYYLLPVDAPSARDVTEIAHTDAYLLVVCP